MKKQFFYFGVLIILFFWDSSFSSGIVLKGQTLFLTTHLMWIILLFYPPFRAWVIYLLLVLLGFTYDLYYLDYLPLTMFTFPILYGFVEQMKRINQVNEVSRFLSFFILIFLLEIGNFSLGVVLGLTSVSYINFIVYHLAPSLLLNMSLMLIGQFLRKKYLL